MKDLTYICIALIAAVSVHADVAADNASDSAYSSGRTTGTDGGNGFGSWTLAAASGGNHIGDTGISGTDTSFGLFSDGGSSSSTAERSFDSSLSAGQSFSVDLGHTATIDRSIGPGPYNGATNWVLNDGASDFDAGQDYAANTTLEFSFTYNGGSSYDYTFGAGSGDNFTASSDISLIDSVKIFNFDQGTSQNLSFNNLSDYTLY